MTSPQSWLHWLTDRLKIKYPVDVSITFEVARPIWWPGMKVTLVRQTGRPRQLLLRFRRRQNTESLRASIGRAAATCCKSAAQLATRQQNRPWSCQLSSRGIAGWRRSSSVWASSQVETRGRDVTNFPRKRAAAPDTAGSLYNAHNVGCLVAMLFWELSVVCI